MTAAPAESSTPPADPPIRSEELDPRRLVEHRLGRNRTKAALRVYRTARGTLAVKDYAAQPWLLRNTLGRWLVRRECRAYDAVRGLSGVPRFFGRVGSFALAMEWIDAAPLAEATEGLIAAQRFERLSEILASLHARGVAMGDLHHRDVLLAADGTVWVIDLAAACLRGSRPGRLRRKWFAYFCEADRFAAARLRARFSGEDREAVIAAASPRVLAWHRRARRLKWYWDKLRGVERLPPIDDHWKF